MAAERLRHRGARALLRIWSNRIHRAAASPDGKGCWGRGVTIMIVRIIVAVAKFLYGYVVGDDLPLAIVIVALLVATGWLVGAGVNAWLLVPLMAVLLTGLHIRFRMGE